MISRQEMIDYITQCVDAAMPILWEDDSLNISRGYEFMLDKDKKAAVSIVFKNRI